MGLGGRARAAPMALVAAGGSVVNTGGSLHLWNLNLLTIAGFSFVAHEPNSSAAAS